MVEHVLHNGQLTEQDLARLLLPRGVDIAKDLTVRDPSLPPLSDFHVNRRTALIINHEKLVAEELAKRQAEKQAALDAAAKKQVAEAAKLLKQQEREQKAAAVAARVAVRVAKKVRLCLRARSALWVMVCFFVKSLCVSCCDVHAQNAPPPAGAGGAIKYKKFKCGNTALCSASCTDNPDDETQDGWQNDGFKGCHLWFCTDCADVFAQHQEKCPKKPQLAA
jgi:hypothetical protein